MILSIVFRLRGANIMQTNINHQLISNRIKELRIQKGLTQTALSELAGISSQYLCQVENGKKSISLSVLLSIAQGLDVGLDEFFYGNNKASTYEYDREFKELLSDCSYGERKILCEILRGMKSTLRNNKELLLENKEKIKFF